VLSSEFWPKDLLGAADEDAVALHPKLQQAADSFTEQVFFPLVLVLCVDFYDSHFEVQVAQAPTDAEVEAQCWCRQHHVHDGRRQGRAAASAATACVAAALIAGATVFASGELHF
jgi:hypothetical protein